MREPTTVKDLLDAVINDQGDSDVAGIALVIWGADGEVVCQYSGVQVSIPDICRLLLAGTVELTRRLDVPVSPPGPSIISPIELVE